MIPIQGPQGESWFIRVLPWRAYADMQKALADLEDRTRELAIFASWVLVDASGARVCPDYDAVEALPWNIVWDVWDKGGTLNGLTKKAQEEAEKNSIAP